MTEKCQQTPDSAIIARHEDKAPIKRKLSMRCFDAVNLAHCAFNNTNESVGLDKKGSKLQTCTGREESKKDER